MSVSIEGHKILSFYQDAKKLIKGELVIPRFVSMWLTTSCDLSCSYCFFNDKNKEKKFADTNKVKKFIDEISSLGVESLELCLHPDVSVRVKGGVKRACEVLVGDEVLTHLGRFKKVEKTFSFPHRGDVVGLRTFLDNRLVRMTNDHKVLAVRGGRCLYEKRHFSHCRFNCSYSGCKRKYLDFSLQWIEAGDLKVGDYLVYPRLTDRSFSNVSEDEMEFFGRYISDGCLVGSGRAIKICFGDHERLVGEALLILGEKLYGLKGKIKKGERRSFYIQFCSTVLAKKFKELFGNGAINKKFPEKFLSFPEGHLIALYKGLNGGDGWKYCNRVGYTTVSYHLAALIKELLIRLNKLPSLAVYPPRLGGVIAGKRVVGRHPIFEVVYSDNVKGHSSWMDENFVYSSIKEVVKENYVGPLFDIRVAEDHSYVANGFVVSNSGGGEPTLHPDCFDIIEYAHKKGLKVGLLTNGCKFNFDKMMNLSYVRFGIDSTTSKQFNHIKGGTNNRFDILLYNIKKLLSFRKDNEFPYIGMKFMINQQNYTCIDSMVSLSFSMGVDYCHFKGTHSDKYKLTDLQILGVNSKIAKNKETFPNFVFGSVSKCIATTKCFMAPIHAVVTPDGNILNCCYFYSNDKIIGNAFDTNFKDIWFSDRHKSILSSIPVADCSKVDCRFSYYNTEMKLVVENGKYNMSFI